MADPISKNKMEDNHRRYPILTSVLHVLLCTYINTYGARGKRKKEEDEEEERRSRGGGDDSEDIRGLTHILLRILQ